MTSIIENFVDFDQKFDFINNVIIFLSIKDIFEGFLAPQWFQMGTIEKFETFGTHGPCGSTNRSRESLLRKPCYHSKSIHS